MIWFFAEAVEMLLTILLWAPRELHLAETYLFRAFWLYPCVETADLGSGLTIVSTIGTPICGSGVLQIGFGEFAGPDFSVLVEKATSPFGMKEF